MRIVAISDTHGLHSKLKLPLGRILVHAGDASNQGTEQEFRDFAAWFRLQPHEHKVFVAGNHDRFVESHRRDAVEMLGPDVHYLQDSGCTIEGYEFWGSPWVAPFCNWAFNASDNVRELAFDLIPADIDILITHTPPYGDQDKFQGEKIGCRSLAQKLFKLDRMDAGPAYHIFGHCHNGYGIRNVEGHRVSANVAQCTEQYKLLNPPVVLNV